MSIQVRRLASALTVAALGLSLLPGPVAAADPVVVRLGTTPLGSSPYDLNPLRGWDWFDNILTYEQLTGEGLDGQPIPQFAASWTHSDDGLTWTFTIPAGKKWSDGKPATARDVAFTFKYLLDSVGTDFELGAGMERVSNIADVVESVVATDDRTAVMKLRHPSMIPFESSVFILPEHVWKDVTPQAALDSFDNPAPVVGSGPFHATELKADEFLRLERNPWYTGPFAVPAVDEIQVTAYKTTDAATIALKRGEIDAVDGLSPTDFKALAGEPGIVAESSVTPLYDQLKFNVLGRKAGAGTDALADPAFRDALGYAIDRQVIVDRAMQGQATPGLTPVSPLLPDYYAGVQADLAPIARRFDLAEAARRLDAAGYAAGPDGIRLDKAGKPLTLRLFYPVGDPQYPIEAQLIVDWFGAVGVTVAVTSMEGSALWPRLESSAKSGDRNWDMSLGGVWPDAYPGGTFVTFISAMSGAGNAGIYFENAEYDRLFKALGATIDPQERLGIASQMAKLLYQDEPFDTLIYHNHLVAYRTDTFTGWTKQPAGGGRSIDTYYPEQTWANLRLVGSEPSPVATAGEPSADASGGATATPAPASAAPSPAAGDTGSAGGGAPVLPIVAGLGVLVIVVLLLVRRRSSQGA